MDFYGPLFGWEFRDAGAELNGQKDEYFTAMLNGQKVAGIKSVSAPDDQPIPPMWSTSVRTMDIGKAIEGAVGAGGRLLLGPLAEPGGQWAMLMDPTGAAFGLLDSSGTAGAELLNEPGMWMMSSLHTPDTAAAGKFYRDIFGWEAELRGSGSAVSFLRLPGYAGGKPGHDIPEDVVAVMTSIDGGSDPVKTPPHWGVNLRVADTDATATKTRELRGQVLMPPTATPEFINAVLMDPQGAVFSVSQVLAPVQ
ncbi:VOC family protein [Arthrobacter monumenti]